MNFNDLKTFLIAAKKRGYASNGELSAVKEEDGSKSTRYEQGVWKFHDNWFGGEPFGGREVVFYKKIPYWLMVYYGSESKKTENLIIFLIKALRVIPKEMPIRGPKTFEEKAFLYKNLWEGTIDKFIGKETIYCNGKEVYQAKYIGGLIDH